MILGVIGINHKVGSMIFQKTGHGRQNGIMVFNILVKSLELILCLTFHIIRIMLHHDNIHVHIP